MLSPEQALAGINSRFGRHPRRRALHAKGTLCEGTFTASPQAASLTRAAHMQGDPVRATARVSNGSGDPGSLDYAPDVRGLAVTFWLPDGERTDISSQTASHFPTRSPDAFIALVGAAVDGPAKAWKVPLALAQHRPNLTALGRIAKGSRPPTSYATCPYYAIHAFRWVDAEGGSRFVRYTWLPEVSEEPLSGAEAKRRGADYLQEEIRSRLAAGPARFTLQVQIAAPEDPVDDPAKLWPDARTTVAVGTLELTAVTTEGDDLVFDPMRLTDGIEPSDDPILRYRPRVYALSHEART